MQKQWTLILLSLVFFLISCHTTKLDPDSYTDKQIVFGNGGGFAGAYHEYVLQDSGDIFFKEGIKASYTWIKRLKKEEVDQIFSNYQVLELENMEFNKPGNLYYFIGMKKNGDNHKLVWSDESKPDKNIQLIYRILMHHIQA